ncbi:MAG: branched-chain amino acid ABC transporter permease [Myxococcales bacterium]|jgi:branched-chain amino acid transport system permease protein
MNSASLRRAAEAATPSGETAGERGHHGAIPAADAPAPRATPAVAPGHERPRGYRPWIAASMMLLVLPHVPGLDSDFGRSLLTQMAIAAVFALSYNVLLGQTGLLSFGHAAFFGLGGYVAIHFMQAINRGLPLPIPLAPLAGAAGGLVFGIVFGSATTRRGGTIFALISLGVGELVYAATFLLPGYFGGEEGITASRTRGPHLPGIDFGSQLQVYYLVAAWAFVAALLMYAFTRTPLGRMCQAVRDNPERVEFIGYNPQRVRFFAFAIAAMFAGLAGGLHAINYEIVGADAVGAQRSGNALLMAYIGGTGHFAGPVLGAAALTWLQAGLSGYTSAWLLYVGVFFMLMIVCAPAGLAGILERHGRLLRTKAWRPVAKAYAIALVPALAMAAGAIVLVEMSYRLATQPELGTVIELFRMQFDAASAWPWVEAAAALAGGLIALRQVSPRIAAAWNTADDEVRVSER